MKILVIDLDNIGDVVMASFIPRKLKELFPQSYVGFLVKEYSREVLIHNPFVNELIIFNPPWLGDLLDNRFTWLKTWQLLRKLKSDKYDLAIVVNADWRKAMLAKFAGIAWRIGADKKKSVFFLTDVVSCTDDPKKHTVSYNLDLLKTLGTKENEVKLEVFINDETRHWADNFLRGHNIRGENILIGIHPGAGHQARIWPANNYVKLIEKLIENKRVKILLFDSKADGQAQEIAKNINHSALINVGNISVLQMAALFNKCRCVIAQDSGPMHLATAVGAKVVAIFGPSNHWRFGPYGNDHTIVRSELACSPCGSDPDCRDRQCLYNINPEQLFKALEAYLEDERKHYEIERN